MARGSVGHSGVGLREVARVLSCGQRAGRKVPESEAMRSEMASATPVGVADAQTGVLHDIQIPAGCRLGHALLFFHVKCLLVCTGLLSAVLLILALSSVRELRESVRLAIVASEVARQKPWDDAGPVPVERVELLCSDEV